MRFVVFVVDSRSGSADRGEIVAIDAFNDDLRSRGELLLAVGLAAPTAATVFDNRAEHCVTRAGSVFDGEEFFSGMWIIDVESHEAAVDRATRASRACNRKVELRPIL